jgi:hypothetical protein
VGEEKMIVINALVSALRARGLQVIEQPQAATNTNAHIDLWLTGYSLGGEKFNSNPGSYETLTFSADAVACGVARQFVGGLRKILKKLMELENTSLEVPVPVQTPSPNTGGIKMLKAHFQRIAEGVFEYEPETAPMPARFVEKWRITITYPASIAAEEKEEEEA